jgi:hypothetical protein
MARQEAYRPEQPQRSLSDEQMIYVTAVPALHAQTSQDPV